MFRGWVGHFLPIPLVMVIPPVLGPWWYLVIMSTPLRRERVHQVLSRYNQLQSKPPDLSWTEGRESYISTKNLKDIKSVKATYLIKALCVSKFTPSRLTYEFSREYNLSDFHGQLQNCESSDFWLAGHGLVGYHFPTFRQKLH